MFFRKNFFEIFSQLFNDRFRFFFSWIRLISFILLILQIQTLKSISTYALALHKHRKLLQDELHTIRILFLTTMKRQENPRKILFTQKRKIQKKFRQRSWTI
ncbi:unnamed protein product [Adineta steineri]|uniref:Transmembrane protein n=1 Tax=Adineta steineri TaxID=433720 RepID=A0A814CIC2_9BILA|nr:unnamed protein product [Adineta steineri]CAF3490182.1 unnamed protein product [Adineta steineri]